MTTLLFTNANQRLFKLREKEQERAGVRKRCHSLTPSCAQLIVGITPLTMTSLVHSANAIISNLTALA
ncbi:hypothetical protein ABC766_23010 [Methylobacterium fujisawaense]|uniref:hypothetical protein n=1 Tax=Methylobacterium fujisawaense TaxID=107400 RepID=UPI00313D908D